MHKEYKCDLVFFRDGVEFRGKYEMKKQGGKMLLMVLLKCRISGAMLRERQIFKAETRKKIMKPALGALLVLALLSGVAFASGAGIGPILVLRTAQISIVAIVASVVLSIIAIALWRKEKEGSLKKRIADFAVQVALINATPWLLEIIGIYIFLYIIPSIVQHINLPASAQWTLLLAPLPPGLLIAVYICREYYAKISSWKSLIAAFLVTPLLITAFILIIIVLAFIFPLQMDSLLMHPTSYGLF